MIRNVYTRILKRARQILRQSRAYKEEILLKSKIADEADKILTRHLQQQHSRALFIDMGSNVGQAFDFFSNYYNPAQWDYWLVEANPLCIESLKTHVGSLYSAHRWPGAWRIINAAVSASGGRVRLYGVSAATRGPRSTGASIVADHNSCYYESTAGTPIETESICASDLIFGAAASYQTIVVKMDIESAEYDALENLIKTGAIDRISHLYIEWHARFYSKDKLGSLAVREQRLKRSLAAKYTEWR